MEGALQGWRRGTRERARKVDGQEGEEQQGLECHGIPGKACACERKPRKKPNAMSLGVDRLVRHLFVAIREYLMLNAAATHEPTFVVGIAPRCRKVLELDPPMVDLASGFVIRRCPAHSGVPHHNLSHIVGRARWHWVTAMAHQS